MQSYKCIAVIGLDAMVELTRDEWIKMAPLTERKAEALWRRHVEQQSRQEAAEAMDCSPSNVDNLERAARSEIVSARNLVSLAGAIDAAPDDPIIGSCAECDQPTSVLVPEDGPDGAMLCEECADE